MARAHPERGSVGLWRSVGRCVEPGLPGPREPSSSSLPGHCPPDQCSREPIPPSGRRAVGFRLPPVSLAIKKNQHTESHQISSSPMKLYFLRHTHTRPWIIFSHRKMAPSNGEEMQANCNQPKQTFSVRIHISGAWQRGLFKPRPQIHHDRNHNHMPPLHSLYQPINHNYCFFPAAKKKNP